VTLRIFEVGFHAKCGWTVRLQDNEWRRVIGFLTSVVDGKLDRAELDKFGEDLDGKLRCMARHLSGVQSKLEDADDSPAAGTKKARCLSCDKITRAQRSE